MGKGSPPGRQCNVKMIHFGAARKHPTYIIYIMNSARVSSISITLRMTSLYIVFGNTFSIKTLE